MILGFICKLLFVSWFGTNVYLMVVLSMALYWIVLLFVLFYGIFDLCECGVRTLHFMNAIAVLLRFLPFEFQRVFDFSICGDRGGVFLAMQQTILIIILYIQFIQYNTHNTI